MPQTSIGDFLELESARLEPGAVLGGRYEILATVGRGGMGAVYQARDARLDCIVAVKELNDRSESEEERAESVRLFEREARLLAQLAHPNLPRVSDYFVEDGRRYLVMDFIEGETLEARLQREHRIPLTVALEWAVHLADALVYLHSQSPPIVFRDLKPANVMVTPDETIKLIDFGIARRYQEGAAKDTLLYGSPGYSPPEQYGRTQTDARADIYALGATLHHLVTGRDPSHSPFKFASVRSLDPSLPPSLDLFIKRCVEMAEEKRIQSAVEARDTLARISSEIRKRALGASSEAAAAKPKHSLAGVLSVGILLLIIAGVGVMWARQPRRDRVDVKQSSPPAQIAPPTQQTPGVERPGSLIIESEPEGAGILLDGKEIGRTPLTLNEISAGAHRVELISPGRPGVPPWSRDVQIKPGESIVLNADMSPNEDGSEGPAAPKANVELVKAQAGRVPSLNPRNLEAGVYFELAFRVAGASGKSGSAAAYLFQADGSTPVPAPVHAGPYRDPNGQLHCAASIQVDADPAEFPAFALSVPDWAIPPDSRQLTWRFVIHLEGIQIFRSEAAPIPPGQ